MNIIDLRRQLDDKRAEMRSLLESGSNGSSEFKDKFEILRNEAEAIKFNVEQLELLEVEEKRSMEEFNSGSELHKFEMPTDEELRSFLLNDNISNRSMDTSNTSDTVIPEVQRQIMKTLTENSPIRLLSDHKTTSVAEYKIPVQINGASVAEAAENDARGETSTPTLTMVSATLTETYAQPKVSQHLLDLNSGFDIQGFVNGAVADAYSEHENQKFADVLNNATLSTGAFVFGQIRTEDVDRYNYPTVHLNDVRALIKTLKQSQRKKAVFLISEDVLTDWEQMVDKDDKPLVGTVEEGCSKKFLGYPVYVCDELDEGSLYFGNFKRAMAVIDHTGSMGGSG